MKTLNYATPINYFKKTDHTINTWLDFLSYAIEFNEVLVQHLRTMCVKYSANTNVEYFSVTEYKNLEFYSHSDHQSRFGYSINIHMQTDEFSIPAFQIYFNNDHIKFTIYWLTFRLQEKLWFDMNILMYSILSKYWIDEVSHLLRIDYKYDIFNIKPCEFYKRLKKNNITWSKKDWTYENRFKNRNIQKYELEYRNKWTEIETLYIWSRDARFLFSRIYRKDIDSKKKWKDAFYQDYPNPTTRLEFQMGYKFIWTLSLSQAIEKLEKYIWFPSNFEWNYYLQKRYDPNAIINTEKYINRWINSTIKIAENWIDMRPAIKRVNKEQKKFYYRVFKVDHENH